MAADVIVFVKAPRAGAVKTRLAQSVGAEVACDIYKVLLSSVLDTLSTLPRIQVRFAPDDAHREIDPWLRPGWQARPQGKGDLGERMLRAFREAFHLGAAKAIVVGSDCPEMTAADIGEASRALSSQDLVLGPATDGGYWLIGLARFEPALFHDMPWSSSCVLAQTVARAAAAGMRVHLLRTLSDIDTAQDWERYQELKRTQCGTPAPN